MKVNTALQYWKRKVGLHWRHIHHLQYKVPGLGHSVYTRTMFGEPIICSIRGNWRQTSSLVARNDRSRIRGR